MDNRAYHSDPSGYSSAENAYNTNYSPSADPYVLQPTSNQWVNVGGPNNVIEGGVHVRDGYASSRAVEDRSDQIFDPHRAPDNFGKAPVTSCMT